MAVYEIKSPTELFTVPRNVEKKNLTIFLGGSINGGMASEWQNEIVDLFKRYDNDKYCFTLLNPRRTDWNKDTPEDKNNEKFREQVEWELSHLEKVDIIFMVFDKEGISPVSLIEFGLYAKQKKIIMCCPNEYFKSANLYITAEKYNVPYSTNFLDFKSKIQKFLISLQNEN
jgi:hypothetical protein